MKGDRDAVLEEKSFLAVLQLPLLSSAAFPSLPSLSPTPALKLQHPLSVSDAEVPRLTQQRWDGGRWGRQAGRVTAKCSMWKGKMKERPWRGGLPCAGKSRHQSFRLNLQHSCSARGRTSAGWTLRFQLCYLRHQRQLSSSAA